jgi:hypothetical protein
MSEVGVKPMSTIKPDNDQIGQKAAVIKQVALSEWAWVMLKELSVFYGVSPTETLESLVLDAVLSKQGSCTAFCSDE